ncbi:uncharacterized protein A1O9_12047 [Exophiala aquamarina CBS 119918]|uniref:Uncharacterized protein n=1 Tax=Exophiala aquamarina CBS 119918 TaxID=1182545 RepID=A0A072NXA3_9EURO|nr:uncharacterized protein A1O9_12047 [Exophiala aquamarina CBS 119918]KEF52057.1 hypothetical protein A1O9_12047 [Exophiala aquamarina CBS 119918]
MDPVPVKDAKKTTKFAFLASSRDLVIGDIQKGLSRPCRSLLVTRNSFIHRYVELLEIQQEQLVQGIQKLYQQLQERTAWDGAPLKEASNGLPLTHDILEGLGIIGPDVLVTKHDFYGDLETLQQGLVNGDEGDLTADDASSDILFPSRKSARSPDLCDVSERYPPRTCTDPDTRMPLNVSAPNEWEFSNLPFEHLPPRSSGHILDLYDPIDSISSPGYPMVENINPPTAFFAALSGSWCPWDAQALTPVGQMG